TSAPVKHEGDADADAESMDAAPITPGQDQDPDQGTPLRRRARAAPSNTGTSGGRWPRGRGGSSLISQPPLDSDGNEMAIVNDEVDLPIDPEGETKVDALGHLLGGREYRVRTFTVLNKGDRLYMLSTEPARCMGFRDSYLFFQKHRLLYKTIIDDEQKRDMIGREILPHSYKGRAIGVVTARSVFREFGAKIVIGGRKIVDDYYVQEARDRGDVEGEIAVPEDRLPPPGGRYNRNQYVAWHGASHVYRHSGQPASASAAGAGAAATTAAAAAAMPAAAASTAGGRSKSESKKHRKANVASTNWMVEHAKAASDFNSSLTATRSMANQGLYDIHTNMMQYPKNMQPTHVRFEPVTPSAPAPLPRGEDDERGSGAHDAQYYHLVASASKLALSSAHDSDDRDAKPHDTAVSVSTPQPRSRSSSHSSHSHPPPPTSTTSSTPSIFPPVPRAFSRALAIHDITYEPAPATSFGLPGSATSNLGYDPTGAIDNTASGLVAMRSDAAPFLNISRDVLDALPPDCRAAYLQAARAEYEWKLKWRDEMTNGAREEIILNYTWNAS
ncbi:hypothetical protein KEM52_000612, partial [Ascosphaera acerosa]